MERFAFKIDAALKANLYKICRLCGIDNPGKVPILLPNEANIIDLDDPSLSQKVLELVGFTVTVDDKMPQTMCSLCVDKINDFYEFREMCYATNKQTRNLLGLQQMEPLKLLGSQPVVKAEPQTTVKRGRKRKTDESFLKAKISEVPEVKKEPMTWRKKQRLQQTQQQLLETKTEPEIKNEPMDTESRIRLPGKKGRKAICSVCGEKFASKDLAEEHKSAVHVPSIPRYICNACNQTHHNQGDIRAHQLWHKLSKTPYKCPLCDVNVPNNYAFSRHLREHTPPTPVQLLVLDRECPLCKKTFVTNFFYNTHRCAIRKRKCGGCNRALNTEVAFMRHAPVCSKIYLNHSKHILPEAANTESQMCIKNEVEEDYHITSDSPASAIPPDFMLNEHMQPVVVIERLASPLLRASAEPQNTLGASKSKNSERVSSKNYLKRVDELLKNTMSTLVSIKHEPEVHINDTMPAAAVQPENEPQAEMQEEEEEEQEPPSFSDFHEANDDSDEEESEAAAVAPEPAAMAASIDDNVPSVSVKQEPRDEAYEKQSPVKQEPLKLKLKITKNHGKLNSSLIDDLDEAGLSRSSKKKKKRKHKEREKEANSQPKAQEHPMVSIKQERLDADDVPDGNQATDFQPQATVMTSIPMSHLESSFNDNDIAAQDEPMPQECPEPEEDVKPNRMELDRLMQITHVASGVDIAEEAMPLDKAVEATPDEPLLSDKGFKSPPNEKSAKPTARKSTGGAKRKPPAEESPRETTPSLQIVAVESGEAVSFNMPPNICIKPEPRNRGYADDEPEGEPTAEINHNEKIDEENAYINSLDFNNMAVKQEKDLDISDPTANGSEPEAMHLSHNGLERGSDSEDSDGEDSASSADEAEEAMEEDEGERIYREIELPLLEPENQGKEATQQSEEAAPENMEVQTPAAKPDVVGGVELPKESLETVGEVVQPQETPAADAPVETLPELETLQDLAALLEDSEITGEADPPQEAPKEVADTEPPLNTPEVVGETQHQSLESPEVLGEVEPQLETPEALAELEPPLLRVPEPDTAFNFVITNICSQAAETPQSASGHSSAIPNLSSPPPNPESLEKSDTERESPDCQADTLPEISLNAPKDIETQALPLNLEESSFICDEEQQNVLNHELSEQQAPLVGNVEQSAEAEEKLLAPVEEELPPQLEEELPGPSSRPNEETENRINEQQQEMDLEGQRQPRCQVEDDSNINEIAENNNNANIERELQDDANVPQENVTP
ncbi:probable serine/threonine-protein kinase kinX isoform X1 [Drosophila persimilis]|uniref:probable serine/threonine-protein kinase kinX isoform X1 n=1 Tax=Drosophila persimilis TaxID=7234 RepID=UPI000F07A166|nr:probable serine/threonine-protein kinase kinX isoform X1 [Drosophila persimilis]